MNNLKRKFGMMILAGLCVMASCFGVVISLPTGSDATATSQTLDGNYVLDENGDMVKSNSAFLDTPDTDGLISYARANNGKVVDGYQIVTEDYTDANLTSSQLDVTIEVGKDHGVQNGELVKEKKFYIFEDVTKLFTLYVTYYSVAYSQAMESADNTEVYFIMKNCKSAEIEEVSYDDAKDKKNLNAKANFHIILTLAGLTHLWQICCNGQAIFLQQM